MNDTAYRSKVEQLVQALRALPEVASVISYYETGDPEMVSADRRVLRAQVEVADIGSSDDDKIEAILDTVYATRPEADASGFYIGMAGTLSVDKQKQACQTRTWAASSWSRWCSFWSLCYWSSGPW